MEVACALCVGLWTEAGADADAAVSSSVRAERERFAAAD